MTPECCCGDESVVALPLSLSLALSRSWVSTLTCSPECMQKAYASVSTRRFCPNKRRFMSFCFCLSFFFSLSLSLSLALSFSLPRLRSTLWLEVKNPEPEGLGIPYMSLEELLSSCDFISIHV